MKPNSILGKYLIKQIVFNFIFVLLMIAGVVLLFEIIELLRRTSDRTDATFGFILKMAMAKLPRTIDMVFPFVMMIAAMITFWKVSKSNEFVIIRAAGVSIWGFLTPVLFATFLIGVVNVTVVNPISANMYELFETMEFRYKTKNPEAVLFSNKGLWLREAIDEERFVVLQSKSARQEKNSLFLMGVTVLEMDRRSQLLRRIESFVAVLEGDYLDFKDVKLYKAGEPVESLASYKYKTALTLDRIKENFIAPDAISFWDLPDTIRFYETSGFSAQKHRLRYLSLLAQPFLLIAMVLVAAVFALRPNNRSGGIMYLIVGGISTGFLVYFLSQVIYAFGINSYIPSFLAVWTPALITSLISISILLHLEDG